MMNAGVKDIGIITTQNYFSLMKHVGEGGPWDYNRKNYKLMFLPPFCSENVGSVYDNRLEAMQCNLVYLEQLQSDYVLISGSDYVANIDFRKMLDYHIESKADITGLCTRKILNTTAGEEMTSYKVDEDNNIYYAKYVDVIEMLLTEEGDTITIYTDGEHFTLSK
jgi:glucose-1-phosphate adenylyltransferase